MEYKRLRPALHPLYFNDYVISYRTTACDLREAEEEAGDGALLHVESAEGVGHVDEKHGAPNPGVG